jgi:hypothetical protein
VGNLTLFLASLRSFGKPWTMATSLESAAMKCSSSYR